MMMDGDADVALWAEGHVSSPGLPDPEPVIAAKGIPYLRGADARQRLKIYLPKTDRNAELVGT